jgi:parallel beta-helix repeat protein
MTIPNTIVARCTIVSGMLIGCAGQVLGQSTVVLTPGSGIQEAVTKNPDGTTFILKAGTYRNQQIWPRHRTSFIGEPGAVLSGAKVISSFAREGNYWVAYGQAQEGQVIGACNTDTPRCNRPEELFLNSVRLRHVASLGAVGPGRWYMDYPNNRLYMGDDPTGRLVEASTTMFAFNGSASDVTIRGLTIEKYANPGQHGAINGKDGTGGAVSQRWLIEDNVIQLNHGGGISIGNEMTVRRNRIVMNGQIGLCGEFNRVMRNVVVEDNEIASNNEAGYQAGWEAGGTKFITTDGLVLRRNHVHHNHGPGLWVDGENINVLYDDNVVEDNGGVGIFHEISYAAVIRNNTVRRNGKGWDTWLWGAQIAVAASPNVEIHNNTVEVDAAGGDGIALIQQNRGSWGRYGPFLVTNTRVHHNTITFFGTVGQHGGGADFSLQTLFGITNRFDYNTYRLANPSGAHFVWATGTTNWNGFRAQGHEANGTLTGTTQGGDSVPPVITEVATGSISSSGVTITWKTNEPANAQVQYGTTVSYGATTTLQSSGATAHTVSITGLQPGTLYNFRARSADTAGNVSMSSNLTFTTTASAVQQPAPPTQAPVVSGLGAHWTFDEAGGTAASDSSGNSNTATLFNGAARAAGRVQGAISLDGGNDYGQAPDSPTLRANDFTLALWMRSSNMSGIRALLSKPFGTSTHNSYVIYLDNGKVTFHTVNYLGYFASAPLAANAWYHIAVVKQGTATRLYINGVQAAAANTAPAVVAYDNHSVLLGTENDGNGNGAFFGGLLDDVRIYTRALSTSEVAALAAQ